MVFSLLVIKLMGYVENTRAINTLRCYDRLIRCYEGGAMGKRNWWGEDMVVRETLSSQKAFKWSPEI